MTLKTKEILNELESEGFITCRNTVESFIKKYEYFQSFFNHKSRGRPRILSYNEELELIEILKENEEASLEGLKQKIENKVSTSTIHRIINRQNIRSVYTRYCQNVSAANENKRYAYALLLHYFAENFDQMIFCDETTVKIEVHSKRKWQSIYDKRKYGKFKHPLTVV